MKFRIDGHGAAALAVLTFVGLAAAPLAAQDVELRWALAGSVGWEPGGLESELSDEFAQAGFDERGARCALCTERVWDDQSRWGGGVTYNVGLRYTVTPAFQTEVQLARTAAGWRNGFRSDIGYLELAYSSWSAAALASYRFLLFTAGVGPALLTTEWKEGQYDGASFERTWHAGYVADLGFIVVENEKAYAGLKLQVRSYFEEGFRFKGELLDLGYQSAFFGMMFGTRF